MPSSITLFSQHSGSTAVPTAEAHTLMIAETLSTSISLRARAHAGFRVGLVVLGEIFELAAEQAARGVHLIDHRLMRDAAVRPERRAGAGERNEARELDRAGLAEAGRGDDERRRDRAGAGEQRRCGA